MDAADPSHRLPASGLDRLDATTPCVCMCRTGTEAAAHSHMLRGRVDARPLTAHFLGANLRQNLAATARRDLFCMECNIRGVVPPAPAASDTGAGGAFDR